MRYRLTLPVEYSDTVVDSREAVRCFSAQFGSSDISFKHGILRPDLPGVAGLMLGDDHTLQPLLLAEGCVAERNLRLRLLAHEIEHARHLHVFAGELVNLPFYEMCFEQLPNVGEFQMLQTRVQSHVESLLRRDSSLLQMSETPSHYWEPDEILARLRAFQVFTLQGKSSALDTRPHEFLEIFDHEDLCWLDEAYLESHCTEAESALLRRRKPR